MNALPTFSRIAAFAAVLCLSLAAPLQAAPLILQTVSQEANTLKFDPKSPDEPGVSVEVMREIERIDPEIKFVGLENYYPTRRIELEIEKGGLDVFFGLIKTPARALKMDFLDGGVLYTQYGQLAVNLHDNVVINSFDDIRKLKTDGVIGVPQGSAFVEYLKNQGGILVDDGAVSVTATLQKMMLGRVRFVYFGGAVLNNYIQDEKLGDKVKILPVRFNAEDVYIVTHKSLSPEKQAKLAAAFNQLVKSKFLERIRAKYGVK